MDDDHDGDDGGDVNGGGGGDDGDSDGSGGIVLIRGGCFRLILDSWFLPVLIKVHPCPDLPPDQRVWLLGCRFRLGCQFRLGCRFRTGSRVE